MVLVQLDHFRHIHDDFARPAADAIARDFAARAQKLLLPSGTVGRVGGEDFMLLLPDYSTAQAERFLAQLQAQVDEARPISWLPESGYRFSAGIANASGGDSLEAVFRSANHALHQAKQAGRNRSAHA